MKQHQFNSRRVIPWLILIACSSACGQRLQNATKDPHIGYIYPAGAQRGTTTTITVGGQYLEGADDVIVSGQGVRAEVAGFDRPLTIGEVVRMRNKLREAAEERGLKELRGRDLQKFIKEHGDAIGITAEDVKKMGEHGQMRRKEEIQEHAQITDKIIVKIEVMPDAKPGRHELRVFRDGRISAPLAFYIGETPEHTETDGDQIEQPLPVVINGQILPAEKDRFSFKASKGDELVAACIARELIPHLADAVPGWFQAVMALYDADGNEVAFADDYRFNPDPAFHFKIPADGTYTLEIKDSIYRGRHDFVYRITLGEIPFVTSIFPLGGNRAEKTSVTLKGENLPKTKISMGDESRIEMLEKTPLVTPIPFALSSLPELMETEPNNTPDQGMPVQQGCVINGRIEQAGDRDVFEIQLEKGAELLAEVTARRLNSLLDSVLMITDAAGNQLAYNNDYEDRLLGRVTHHADARVTFEAPETGTYHIHLGDIQNGGGDDYAYRLQLDRPVPDYELRVVPSNLNGVPGSSVPCTVYALRKDGFTGPIDLKLKNKIDGLRLDGARIPAGQDQVELTLTLPPDPLYVPVALNLEGCANINGKAAVRSAVPAEDMMQAFIYHHLVLVDEILLSSIESGAPRPQSSWESSLVRLRPGQSTTITCDSPTQIDRSQVSLKVEPRNLPDGVTMEEATVGRGQIEITLATGSEAVKGLEGNLLFDLLVERTKPGANQKRDGHREPVFLSAGSLPAVPFEIR